MAAVTAHPAPGKDTPPASPKGRKAGERSLTVLLGRHTLDARAQNFSPKTVKKMEFGLGLFDDFLGGIVDVRRVHGDDLRRFIVHSRERTLWPGMRQAGPRHPADASLRTYAQSVKVFLGWPHKKGVTHQNAMLDDRHPGIFMEDIDFDTGTIRIRGKFGVERPATFSVTGCCRGTASLRTGSDTPRYLVTVLRLMPSSRETDRTLFPSTITLWRMTQTLSIRITPSLRHPLVSQQTTGLPGVAQFPTVASIPS